LLPTIPVGMKNTQKPHIPWNCWLPIGYLQRPL